jgi:DNA replication licensing factor MCM2
MESLIRMSQAHAKMHLRDAVTEEDVNVAIRVMLETFISTQKYSVKTSLEKHFSKYITHARDHHELLLYRLQDLVQTAVNMGTINRRLNSSSSFSITAPVEISIDDFRKSATDLQISRLDSFFNSKLFASSGFSIDERRGKIIKTFHQ